MQEAFVIAPSDTEVDPKDDALIRVTNEILDRTVVVKTADAVGEAAIVAGKIITSLFLVRNSLLVKVLPRLSKSFQASVSRRDETNNIAELTPAMLEKPDMDLPWKTQVACYHGIGDPLLTVDCRKGFPAVVVAGMCYVVRLCERREKENSDWKVRLGLPKGLAGGGIWDLEGRFSGISLATKVRYNPKVNDTLLAIPANKVMDFVESM